MFSRSTIAWLGLALMVGSLIWLEFLPPLLRLTRAKASSAKTGPLSLVIIDAGHGGDDSGTMRNGLMEKDLTLDVARRVERLARMQGLSTIMTRESDARKTLPERAAIANKQNDGIFVSIHFDEGARAEATGVQTFYAVHQMPMSIFPSWLRFLQTASVTPENLESQSLAGFVQEALVRRTRAFDRGTRAQQFYVVANVRHPAVLVEGGFLTNNDDLTKIATDEYREQLAAAITDGLMRYREIANAQKTLALSAARPE
ncbi:MAG: N-acetylmuramoyl-L-alanine amidase [Verrucomicrobiota bacterium]|nr:N-acetylmuramoyl-L-alanine amidase [Verrucomicrobiota bacterium]